MVRARGAVVLTRRLLLLVALQAWDTQAAPRRARGADDGIGGAYRASRLDPGYKPWGHPRVHVDQDARWIPVPEPGGHPRAVPVGSGCLSSRLERVREPQGDPTDVAAGDGYPASWLGSRADPQGGRIETNRETVQKEAFQKGSSHRVPVSDEEREAMQETGTPGADAGKKAEAAGREELRKYYIPVTASALGVLLLGIVVSCVVIARLRKRDPRTQRDQEALGQADTDSAWKSEDQTRDKGKAESGEGTRKGEVAQANEIFSNGSSPSPWPFAAELAQLYRNVSADPSPLPACPSCSLTDSVSSLDTWISLDSPQPNPFWCPCYQYQQGYCTSEDESF
ncbi:uncharacterized protein LOC127028523 isoform X4 [Gymnogyps californianus]|uniref:uncharacterized protein LOC127028523 isoform X4 n=1 Tax=Gymnogyps californianus TaxID=33616 RepID=UPI0021C5F0A9|nr:uncharacterized protein LOC127028523 isoform X4 [Gymnogyps californianus]